MLMPVEELQSFVRGYHIATCMECMIDKMVTVMVRTRKRQRQSKCYLAIWSMIIAYQELLYMAFEAGEISNVLCVLKST